MFPLWEQIVSQPSPVEAFTDLLFTNLPRRTLTGIHSESIPSSLFFLTPVVSSKNSILSGHASSLSPPPFLLVVHSRTPSFFFFSLCSQAVPLSSRFGGDPFRLTAFQNNLKAATSLSLFHVTGEFDHLFLDRLSYHFETRPAPFFVSVPLPLVSIVAAAHFPFPKGPAFFFAFPFAGCQPLRIFLISSLRKILCRRSKGEVPFFGVPLSLSFRSRAPILFALLYACPFEPLTDWKLDIFLRHSLIAAAISPFFPVSSPAFRTPGAASGS